MNITVPGKILVIENRWKEVKKIIESFWKTGEGIVYSSSIPDEAPSNVRLVILDLVLYEGGDQVQPEDYQQAALALKKIESKTQFYLIALWSIYITSDTETEVIKNLKNAYKEQTGKDLPDRILKPFGKKNFAGRNVVDEIKHWINANPEAGLIFEWEKSIEHGRDQTASEIINTGGIKTVVKSVEKEVGKTAASRETFTLFNKLLLRHSIISLEESGFRPLIEKVLEGKDIAQTNTLEWYPKIHYLKSYYQVENSEPLWTGDILQTDLTDPQRKYAIVVTPACDFAQKKLTKIKVVYGIKIKKIEKYRNNDKDVPLPVQKLGKTKKGKWKKPNEIINAIVKGSTLPDRFYILHFLKSSSDDNYFHLLIDFSNVQSRKVKEKIKLPHSWQRICRIDSPYIEDLLQKYASFSARVGTPAIPENVQRAEIERLKNHRKQPR